MNNHEKFTTGRSKLKLHTANSHIISSNPIRFSTDILFSSLVSFYFYLIIFAFFFFFFFEIENIYSDTDSIMLVGK